MERGHQDDYDAAQTQLSERALVTLIGDLGPWRERIVLVGGLAPRYIVGSLPIGASPHAGTTDVDVVIGLVVEESFETYATLQANLKKSGFELGQPSYQWSREVEGARVSVDFLCETGHVPSGRIYSPKQGTGSQFSAFNAPGANLAIQDFVEVDVEANRLDDGGLSTVSVRVASVLAYVVLKILAFQDRHENKDAYDLVYTLVNFPDDGPHAAGQAAAISAVRGESQVDGALQLLAQRFGSPQHDGPSAYANFLAQPEDAIRREQLRNEAVLAVGQFLDSAGH